MRESVREGKRYIENIDKEMSSCYSVFDISNEAFQINLNSVPYNQCKNIEEKQNLF